MHIVLNPKYDRLREQLVQAVRHFDSVGQEIYHARNVIRLIEIDGCRLAVKRYGRMPLKHRMATRVYKANKAKKAFVTSLLLKERSFESPEPVAFLSDRRGLLDATHYFVSVYSDYRRHPRLRRRFPRRGDQALRTLRRTAPRQRLHPQGFLGGQHPFRPHQRAFPLLAPRHQRPQMGQKNQRGARLPKFRPIGGTT